MKTHELLEGDTLGDLAAEMALMKHGRLSREQAKKLAQELRDMQIMVGGKMVPARLRWMEDKTLGTLKFASADIPGSWRSGTAAMGRGKIARQLELYGFSSARFFHDAAYRRATKQNGPHLLFWGPGTPEMDKEKLVKVPGTDEYWGRIKRRETT